MKWALALVASLTFASAAETAAKKYVYLWVPRDTDVQTTQDQDLLRQLLRKGVTRSYILNSGDSPESIVWRLFFVQSKWRNAFGIYKQTILDLNPNAQWRVGDSISVPVGPQYSGTLLPDTFAGAERKNLFRALSYYSFHARQYAADAAADVDQRLLRTWGNLVPERGAEAIDKLSEMGVVGPIHNPYFRFSWWSQVQPLALTDSVPGSLGAFLPLTPATATTCSGPCFKCSQILGLQSQASSRAAVLVADTGLDQSISVPQDHLIYSGGDGLFADDSPLRHGTYVYQEMLQANGGVLMAPNVYVAKVSKVKDGKDVFDVQDIFSAIARFGMRRSGGSPLPDLLIANISAAGNDTGRRGEYPASIPPASENILLVAAAGNDHETINPTTHIYGQFGGPDTPVMIVGALQKDGISPADYSDRSGTYVHLLAQGDCVCGTPNGSLSGTSQAAPLVSSAAALLASRNPRWDVSDVKWRLISTGDRGEARWTAWSLGGKLDYARAASSGIDLVARLHSRKLLDSLELDDVWLREWRRRDSKERVGSILRLTDSQTIDGKVCFTVIRYRASADPAGFCVDPSARIAAGDEGFRADQLVDLILPVPRDRALCGSTLQSGSSVCQ